MALLSRLALNLEDLEATFNASAIHGKFKQKMQHGEVKAMVCCPSLHAANSCYLNDSPAG
jgi:hypothetical protein